MSENKLKVAAYCRVSTDKDDQANSLVSQKKYFEDYIRVHDGWVLNGIYYDEGISGTQTSRRIGFNTMVKAAMHGEIDLILTKEVCRFARNTVDTLYYTRKLKEQGVGVIFIIDHIDTRDSDGELRLTIMASIAQEESRKTSERVKWGQKRQMEQGVVFGRDLIGYTVRNGELIINEEEVDIVRAIFHKYTNEGKGTYIIARELMEEGLYPKRAKKWSNTVILRILRNEKYVGDLCQKKTYTPNYLTHAKKYNRGQEEKVYLKEHHEAIIDRTLWDRTQAELIRRVPEHRNQSKYSNRYWCSGKVYCGLCGRKYVSRTKKLKNGNIYRAWRCHAVGNHGSQKLSDTGVVVGCDNCSINERALLSCVYYCICQLHIDQQKLKREIWKEMMQFSNIESKKTNSEYIQERIHRLSNKKCKAIDLMLDGMITKEDLQEQIKWYDKQLVRLTEANAELQIGNVTSVEKTDMSQKYMDILDDIVSFDEKNTDLYQELLEKIVIYDNNTVEIRLKSVPYIMRLRIHSHGKDENYITDILDMKIIQRLY